MHFKSNNAAGVRGIGIRENLNGRVVGIPDGDTITLLVLTGQATWIVLRQAARLLTVFTGTLSTPASVSTASSEGLPLPRSIRLM